ncbi:translation initiation factor IF-2, partial [Streptomyces sp. NPDC047123]
PAPASAATAGGPTAGATPPPTASPAEGVTGVTHAKYSTDDTEQLRLALRDYRETAERLLRL